MEELEVNNEIKDIIVNHFRSRNIVPIIGSGFTRECAARSGSVPSGDDLQKDMLKMIKQSRQYPQDEYSALEKDSFNNVSEVFHDKVSEKERRIYFQQHFCDVIIRDKGKRDFLNIEWPYIYTLNIDDGIEKNGPFSYVILPNREINTLVFDDNKCVIKLHGDIHEYLKYPNSLSLIFDPRQYATSIQGNHALLAKLKNDYNYNNVVFIGCSLSNEFDLLSIPCLNTNQNNRYYCHVGELTERQRIRLKNHGITHCLKFKNFNDVYTFFVDAYEESKAIQPSDLMKNSYHAFTNVPIGHSYNVPFLLQGKDVFQDSGRVTLPYHFFHRYDTDSVVDQIDTYPVFVVSGSGCSGKTYFGIEVMKRIRNKTTYFFKSTQILSPSVFDQLFCLKDAVFVFDNHALSEDQTKRLFLGASVLKSNNSVGILIKSNNDRDIPSIIYYLTERGSIDRSLVCEINLDNKLRPEEANELNSLLVKSSIPILDEKKTLVDNILILSSQLKVQNQYTIKTPNTDSFRHIAALIMLATKTKIYSEQAEAFDIVKELEDEVAISSPMIEVEYSLPSEKSSGNNSPKKYVLNAKYWIWNALTEFAKDHSDYIVKAYKYIIQKCIESGDIPGPSRKHRRVQYRDYILFDNINQIFANQTRNIMGLIRNIYVALSDDLSADPSYLHQRAKCFIRASFFSRSDAKKYEFLQKALHDALTAASVFKKQFLSDQNNEMLAISLSHVKYTYALCLCHICQIQIYQDKKTNGEAICAIEDFLSSPCFDIQSMRTDTRYNYGNAIEKTIVRATEDPQSFDVDPQFISFVYEKLIKNG